MNRLKNKSMLVGLLWMFVIWCMAPAAHAESPWPVSAAWLISGPGQKTPTDTVYGFDFTYDYNDPAVNSAMQTWTLAATSSEAKTVAYNWHYSGLHAWYEVTAKLSAYVIHGGTTSAVPLFEFIRPSSAGEFNGTGSAVFTLENGDTYGFR